MRVQIVGRGRMGTALHRALTAASAASAPGALHAPSTQADAAGEPTLEVLPLAGRGADGRELLAGRDTGGTRDAGAAGGAIDAIVLLAVPDAAIAEAAARIVPGPIVGHLSGATTLGPLAPHDACSLHPLLSVTGAETRLAGAFAAIDGTSDRALTAASLLADRLGMSTFRVRDEDRPAYHAAASVAANFLVALEDVAERLAATAGVPRAALAPLASGALENWARSGAVAALTGPVARGDVETIARQRAAVADRLPSALPLYDAMVVASGEVVARRGNAEQADSRDAGRSGAGSEPDAVSGHRATSGRGAAGVERAAHAENTATGENAEEAE